MADLHDTIGMLRLDAIQRGLLDLGVVYGWTQIRINNDRLRNQAGQSIEYKTVELLEYGTDTMTNYDLFGRFEDGQLVETFKQPAGAIPTKVIIHEDNVDLEAIVNASDLPGGQKAGTLIYLGSVKSDPPPRT